MKEIKHILHAFLLLSASVVILICVKAIILSSEYNPVSNIVPVDNMQNAGQLFPRGKQLFTAKCASCHIIGRDFTGPSLCGVEDRGPWGERENIYKWVRNPQQFMTGFVYLQDLGSNYPAMMMSFPDLSDEEIDEIINYINAACSGTQVKAIAKAN